MAFSTLSLQSDRAERITNGAQRLIESGQFCGIAWQFAQHSKVMHEGQCGWLDKPNGVALPSDALYRIYSMTKPLVSVAAVQLMEEGLLRLTDSVATFLPEFSNLTVLQPDGRETPAAGEMLIEQLLTHRAGLSYDFVPTCPVARMYQSVSLVESADRTLAEFVTQISQFPLAFEPGHRFQYSVATDVLARVLEVVTGQSLPELLQQRIFTPCDMQDTAFHVAPDKQHRLASMFGSRELGMVPGAVELPQPLTPLDVEVSHPKNKPDTFVRGGHGLYSTTHDYQQFLPILLNGKSPAGQRLLSQAMLDLLWANRIPESQMPLFIGDRPMPGYGWNLAGRVLMDMGSTYSLSLPDEGGWSGAAASYFFVHRQSGLNGVVMTQYLGSEVPVADDLRVAFLQALEW